MQDVNMNDRNLFTSEPLIDNIYNEVGDPFVAERKDNPYLDL